jgi:hypothetical protein
MFEDTVTSFAAQANLSRLLADESLQQMSGHHDPPVAAVAQFELYLTKVQLGEQRGIYRSPKGGPNWF